VYQPALDDIAQLSSADATYGGFNSKSTQMYLGNLTDLGNLLGAYKFTVPTSVDASTVGGAVIEASSGHDLVSHDAQQWVMKSDVLANSTEANWRSNNYASIHGAPSVATLNPSTGVRKGNQTTYAEAVTCDKMSAFKSDLADKSVAVRMEAATPDADAALSFETGANRRSRGPQFRPRLVLLKQQGDGTLLDTRPCDPNAPAPVLSDVRVEQNKNADNKTFSGVVSWHTDLPSDSTVLVRPRGANALSWVEVSVPGRTTLHVVEVKGLSLALDYEFLVSSAGCNGARGTDTNAGKGYTFVPPPDAPVTAAAGPYDFESGAQGWTVVDEPDSSGASTWALTTAAARSGSQSWSHSPYKDGADSSIVSPSFATTTGRVRLSWWQSTDLEPDFDYLHVEYSTGGAWAEVAKYTGATGDFANGVFAPQSVVFDVPPAPSMKVRFRLQADDLFSDPQYKGARVDDVTVSQGGRGVPLGAFPSKALSAKSAVTAPALPLHLTPSTADLAAGTARCAPVTTKVYVPPPPNGYWLTAADAGLFTYGDAKFYGSYGGHILNQPVVGMAAKSDHTGYWQVAADGGIFAWGSAPFKGSMGGKQLNKPVVGMAATPDGNGYWLVASDGGIFAFGNAGFYGSTGSIALNQPIVGMASTSTGKGYWLVAADGGIFAFGDAVGRFYGSAANTPKSAPVVGMEPTPLGDGYWMVTRNGAVFAFGGASSKFYGSALSKGVNNIVGMTTMANTAGYWLAGANGAVYPFGGAKDFGSAASYGLFRPVVGIEGY
jgi:hypothetical protein